MGIDIDLFKRVSHLEAKKIEIGKTLNYLNEKYQKIPSNVLEQPHYEYSDPKGEEVKIKYNGGTYGISGKEKLGCKDAYIGNVIIFMLLTSLIMFVDIYDKGPIWDLADYYPIAVTLVFFAIISFGYKIIFQELFSYENRKYTFAVAIFSVIYIQIFRSSWFNFHMYFNPHTLRAIVLLTGLFAIFNYIIYKWRLKDATKEALKEYKREIESLNKRIEEDKSNYKTYKANIEYLNIAYASVNYELESLYAQDFIFEKYRNFFAITQILEYFQAGRCETLEGTNGAYNLYESELRANIIINQLDRVLQTLETIKQNQYLIYREVCSINANLSNLREDIQNLEGTINENAGAILKSVNQIGKY